MAPWNDHSVKLLFNYYCNILGVDSACIFLASFLRIDIKIIHESVLYAYTLPYYSWHQCKHSYMQCMLATFTWLTAGTSKLGFGVGSSSSSTESIVGASVSRSEVLPWLAMTPDFQPTDVFGVLVSAATVIGSPAFKFLLIRDTDIYMRKWLDRIIGLQKIYFESQNSLGRRKDCRATQPLG